MIIKKLIKKKLIIAFLVFFCLDSFVIEQPKNQKLLDIILKQAQSFIGKKYGEIVIIKGKKIKLDCIGTVRAIFYSIDIDITKYFHKYNGNGVSRLYYSLKEKDTIHGELIPEVGDVIFWDNTWDRNGDGVSGNDPLTHAGLVIKIDEDSTIHYIHANYVLGIIVEQMNLKYPTKYTDDNGKIINSPMYINSSLKRHPKHWLSGDLFKHFGGILKIKDHFEISE